MTQSISINGASYEFDERTYSQLITGQLDASPAVLRYFIKKNLDDALQGEDEQLFLSDLLEDANDKCLELAERIEELEKQLAAKNKKAKKPTPPSEGVAMSPADPELDLRGTQAWSDDI